jgi:hypothetical protein
LEEAERWVLPVGEGVVTQLQIDFAFGFTIEQWLRFRIGEPFIVRSASGEIECDPENPASVAPLLDLHQAVVTEAAVYKDGSLSVTFADGRLLRVPPGDHYEAFEVTGSWAGGDPFRLISLPGGGLAEWVDAA